MTREILAEMSEVEEKKQPEAGDFSQALVREVLGDEIPAREAEEIAEAVQRLAEGDGRPAGRRRRYGARCKRVMEGGRRCKQRGWLGGAFCFQHDPAAAELRKLAGRRSQKRLTKGQEVEELLEETLKELRAGRIKPGQAYATGYLAQLMLLARESRQKETKLDVKWFWEMVELGASIEKAAELRKEKEEKEAREKANQKQENGEPQDTDKPRPDESDGEEEEDDEEEEGVMGYNAGDEPAGHKAPPYPST